MLTGRELLTALCRTKRPVEVIALDGTRQLLEPAQAADLVAGALDWQGRGTKRKISQMRRLLPKPAVRPDPVADLTCWRLNEAAVLPPSPEWFNSVL